jgi:hypothetical protein
MTNTFREELTVGEETKTFDFERTIQTGTHEDRYVVQVMNQDPPVPEFYVHYVEDTEQWTIGADGRLPNWLWQWETAIHDAIENNRTTIHVNG